MTTFARLSFYIKRYWKELSSSILFASLYGIVGALPTYLIKHAVDEVFMKKMTHLIIPIMAIFILFFVLKGFFMYVTTFTMHWVGNKVVNDIRADFFKKIVYFPLSFFQENTTGKVMSHFLNDIQMIHNASSSAIKNGVRSFFEALFLIGFAFLQNWQLAMIMLFVGPLIAITIRKMGKSIKRASATIQNEVGSISSMLQEILVGIREIKAFNGAKVEIERFNKQLDKCFKSQMAYIRLDSLLPASTEVIAMIGGSIVFYIATYQVLNGTITPGQLSAFIASVLLTYQPLKRLVQVYSEIQYGLAAAGRIFTIMDTPFPTYHDRPLALKSFNEQITFEQVSFSYDRKHSVLRDVSLTIKKGESIGILGHSGSGKSTLCDLMLGFIAPTDGRLLIDGQDVAKTSVATLRQHIGYVGQRTFLFNDSVKSNVAYAVPNAALHEIVRACKAAHADEFVSKYSSGYETMVGENGNALSGGQKQRITIARALLKDPEILIFDEATSSLDQESERMIRLTMDELKGSKTLIIVSHRLSLLESVDRLFMIEDGHMREIPKSYLTDQRKHEALMV